VTEKDSTQVVYNGVLKIGGNVYRLLAQVVHEGPAGGGKYRAAVGVG